MRAFNNLFLKDSTILVLFIILGLSGLWLFKEKEKSIFPTASIDLSISKEQILGIAETWTKKLGYEKTPVVKSIVFDDDDQSKTFLEYELGNAKADELMHNAVPIFYWNCKFRKPFDQETMDMQINPSGKLLAFAYNIANDKKIPTLSHKEAQDKAFAFLAQINNWSEADCKLVKDETTVQQKRTDYKFTWEYQKLDWRGAKLRSDVEIAGDTLDGFDYYLKRPEAWDRNYATMRTKNMLLEAIASVFFFSLYPIAGFIFLKGLTRKNIRWRFVIGATAILTLISLAEAYNNWPVILASYSPDTSYKVFLLQSIVGPILSAPFIAMLIAIMAGAGEIIYRKLFPDKLALENIFSKAGMGAHEVRMGLIIGVAWFGLTLGYQILYYWIGKHFHFWCPLEVDNYQVLSTYWPWLSAINLGAFASSNEEILYRVLMLGLCKFVFRKFWLANVLQAAAWGFMHSTYPQQPCYARGLELTIEGVLEGWLISRFGLIPCVVAHYCFDAFACVTSLFSAPILLRLTSIIPFLPVLIAIAYSFIAKRKYQPNQESLLNKTIIAPQLNVAEDKMTEHPVNEYKPLQKKTRWALLALICLGVIAQIYVSKKYESIGHDGKPLHITRQQAIDRARVYLISNHFDLTGYRIGSEIHADLPDHEQVQYLFEQIGFDKTKEIVEKLGHSFVWEIAFKKPLSATEYTCNIDENGKMQGLDLKMAEDDPGPMLSKEKAQAIAESFLKREPKLVPFKLDDTSLDKRKQRYDYHFTFKVPKYKIKDADFKVTVDIMGDIPANSSYAWDLPDKWKWERTKRSSRQEIFIIVGMIVSIAALLALVWWIVFLFRANKIRWHTALIIAASLCIIQIANSINTVTKFFCFYDTTIPLNTFLITSAIGILLGMLFALGGGAFGIALVLAGNSESLKFKLKTMLFDFISLPQEKLTSYRSWLLDAIILSFAIAAAGSIAAVPSTMASFAFNHEVHVTTPTMHMSEVVNTLSGPLAIITTMISQLITIPLMLGFAIAIFSYFRINTLWRFCLTILLTGILCGLSMRYWQDFLIGLIVFIPNLVLSWYILTRVLPRNILTFFIGIWISVSCSIAIEFWKYGWPTFPTEVATSTLLCALPFIYLAYLYTRPKSNEKKQAG